MVHACLDITSALCTGVSGETSRCGLTQLLLFQREKSSSSDLRWRLVCCEHSQKASYRSHFINHDYIETCKYCLPCERDLQFQLRLRVARSMCPIILTESTCLLATKQRECSNIST